jgi:hypothetical protein
MEQICDVDYIGIYLNAGIEQSRKDVKEYHSCDNCMYNKDVLEDGVFPNECKNCYDHKNWEWEGWLK